MDSFVKNYVEGREKQGRTRQDILQRAKEKLQVTNSALEHLKKKSLNIPKNFPQKRIDNMERAIKENEVGVQRLQAVIDYLSI